MTGMNTCSRPNIKAHHLCCSTCPDQHRFLITPDSFEQKYQQQERINKNVNGRKSTHIPTTPRFVGKRDRQCDDTVTYNRLQANRPLAKFYQWTRKFHAETGTIREHIQLFEQHADLGDYNELEKISQIIKQFNDPEANELLSRLSQNYKYD